MLACLLESVREISAILKVAFVLTSQSSSISITEAVTALVLTPYLATLYCISLGFVFDHSIIFDMFELQNRNH